MHTNSPRGICKVTILEIFRSRSTRPVKPPTAVWESGAKRTVSHRKPKMVSLWQGAGDTRMTCNSSWTTLDDHTLTSFIIFSSFFNYYYYFIYLLVCLWGGISPRPLWYEWRTCSIDFLFTGTKYLHPFFWYLLVAYIIQQQENIVILQMLGIGYDINHQNSFFTKWSFTNLTNKAF